MNLTRSNFEAAQPPILIDNGVAVLENEKIERHIMKNIPGGHNLFISDNVSFLKKLGCIPKSYELQEVNKKIENVYSKFKHMLLKRDDTSKNAMTSILTKLVDEVLLSTSLCLHC